MVEILSHKKAYNTCEGPGRPRGCREQDAAPPSGPQSRGSAPWMTEIRLQGFLPPPPHMPAAQRGEGPLPGPTPSQIPPE